MYVRPLRLLPLPHHWPYSYRTRITRIVIHLSSKLHQVITVKLVLFLVPSIKRQLFRRIHHNLLSRQAPHDPYPKPSHHPKPLSPSLSLSLSTNQPPLKKKKKKRKKLIASPTAALPSRLSLSLASFSSLPLPFFFPAMALLRRSPPKTGLQSAIWAAKLAFLLVGIFSIAAFARVAVPYAAAILASTLPRAWAALRTWLVPPYLFITVHLIIIVIWKLSDHKQHHPRPAEDKSPDSPQPVKPKDFGASPLQRKPSPEIWQEISPGLPESDAATPDPAKEPGESSPPSDASCLTTDSDSNSTASSRVDVERSIAPAPESVEPAVEEAAPAAEIEQIDSMDDTWKAIMERSGSRSRSRSPRLETAAGRGTIRAAPAAADPDEMNRRFEDFIKKKKDEIRLQGHEPDRRRLEMVNRALY